ncbi:uncharacterized protein LOC116619731 isoform X2 [Nematostella vectensis]|uniref:uncharacterized protein LOC116619731 isoform X2 n=1 Tax=Nematostella vectensis TaxID=45351 RepID=UPI0020778A0D|nr:uncharacterized protein LOC116619731 isoform X2 [Nematostella vectensis]
MKALLLLFLSSCLVASMLSDSASGNRGQSSGGNGNRPDSDSAGNRDQSLEGRSHDYGCENSSPVKIGCFKSIYGWGKQLMPELLITDRDNTSNVFSGEEIDWKKWRAYRNEFLCRCSDAAKKKGYKKIGLQFYGECWSGPNADQDFDRLGPSINCTQNPKTEKRCRKSNNRAACVGKGFAFYVYEI